MRDFRVFHLRLCFTLFTSAQFSNAGKVEVSNMKETFKYTAPIESFLAKEPNQRDFVKYDVPEKQMLLAIHHKWNTFSFYELGASSTFFTFDRQQVDFQIFHAKSMSFLVEENDDVYHFRVVFSADKHTLDTVYLYLSFYTGAGAMNFKMSIMKVERYERTTRGPIVQQVEDLKPAMYYEQRFQGGRTRSDKKIYKITPCTSAHSHRKLPRLVFRKGTYRAERLDEKVVLELSGFEDCLYILYFEKALHAGVFLGYIKGTSDDITLDIASDVRSYLERGLPLVASTSPSAEDDTRTLQLAKWS